MKMMKRVKPSVANRVGISAQKSTAVTSVGDGLGPQGNKSPVTTNKLKVKCEQVREIKREKTDEDISNQSEIAESYAQKRKFKEDISDSEEQTSKASKDDEKPTFSEQPIKKKVIIPKDTKKYTCFERRLTIGDASHPLLHILPIHRKKLQFEIFKLVAREGKISNESIEILQCFYVDKLLVVECKNVPTLIFIEKNLCKLDGIWPDASLVLCPREAERKAIRICIPYRGMETGEILEILKKQNRMYTDGWTVLKRKDVNNQIWLDVDVDGGTNLRIFHDQDEVFFLMQRAIIKLPK